MRSCAMRNLLLMSGIVGARNERSCGEYRNRRFPAPCSEAGNAAIGLSDYEATRALRVRIVEWAAGAYFREPDRQRRWGCITDAIVLLRVAAR